MFDRRSLLARGLGALVAVSGLNRLEKLVPEAVEEAAPVAASPVVDASAWARSIIASGGLCAPVTPYYAIAYRDAADRPLRDALPAFKVERSPKITYVGRSGV